MATHKERVAFWNKIDQLSLADAYPLVKAFIRADARETLSAEFQRHWCHRPGAAKYTVEQETVNPRGKP